MRELVVFPELALCGYPPEDLVFREDFLSASEAQLQRIAVAVPSIPLLVGYAEPFDGGVANSLAVLDGGAITTVYRKQLLPNYGVFDERRHFTAGDRNAVLELAGRRVGLSICEDVWFDDPVFSALAADGAELVLNASASPFQLGKPAEREQMLRDRARRFGLPIAYCNIVGGQDELVFDGSSVVIDAGGDVVARAPAFEATTLRASLNLGQTHSAGHIDPRRPASRPRPTPPCSAAFATTSARTAFPAPSSASPGASTPRWCSRSPATRSAPKR